MRNAVAEDHNIPSLAAAKLASSLKFWWENFDGPFLEYCDIDVTFGR
jgi:hypothetical protein